MLYAYFELCTLRAQQGVAHRVLTNEDLSTVKKDRFGDFAVDQLSLLVNTPERNALVVRAFMEKAAGRKAITFCCNIQHVLDMTDAFLAQGGWGACIGLWSACACASCMLWNGIKE